MLPWFIIYWLDDLISTNLELEGKGHRCEFRTVTELPFSIVLAPDL
jgi:hypothetical protein